MQLTVIPAPMVRPAPPPRPVDLFSAIAARKRELNAVILAHYYQEADIQDVADFIGDSLALAQQAKRTDGSLNRAAQQNGDNRKDGVADSRQLGAREERPRGGGDRERTALAALARAEV